jgi:hypothetical protein
MQQKPKINTQPQDSHKENQSMVKLLKLFLNWLFPGGKSKHSGAYHRLSHIHRIDTRNNRDVSIALRGITAAHNEKYL